MQADLLEAALKLPDDERRALAARLIESLPPGEDDFELSPEDRAELDRRLDRLERTGPIGEDWETVKARLLARRDS